MGRIRYKPITAKSFDAEWLKQVSYVDFKKNPIIAQFEPHEQDSMFHKFTGRKHKPKNKEGKE
ncbi:MAG: hypothetical protein ACXAC7_12260 [Candidatus Hodarchaeales archaeon]|jgi:hypothetical protein